MNDELTAAPRYRVTGDKWVDNGVGIPAAPGQEFDSCGWPKSDSLEPINEAAKRTIAYWRKNHAVPNHAYPSTPWSSKLNRIFLPHLHGPDTVMAVTKDEVLPNMPAYRALQDVFDLDSNWRPHKHFRTTVRASDVVHVLEWPETLFRVGEFEPANDAAQAVVAYFEEAKSHPLLPWSPWDWFRREIFLPELPAMKDWGKEHIAVRPKPLKQTVIRGRPHSGARRPVEA